jgi:hypothetical protein
MTTRICTGHAAVAEGMNHNLFVADKKFPAAEQNGCRRSLDPGTGTGHDVADGSVGRGMVVRPGGV